jgi:phosphoribosylformylglycinamidine cyclo-ligase
MYAAGEYDVAGFIVGMVARDRMLLGYDIEAGDVVLALPSNGLHTNGYSLAREVLGLNGDPERARERLARYDETLGATLGEALTRPHTSYLNDVAPLLDRAERPVKGMAHITGGGLLDNIPRVLPEGCAVELDTVAWAVPPIFRLIQEVGGIERREMARVFNMGIGLVMIVSPEHVELVESMLPGSFRAGRVVASAAGERVSLRDEG